jgi:bifunctional NMN adenylyltransferase/nudix hydrolase
MLKVKSDKTDVGIIVARFQCHELTPGHVELIESVKANHDRVIIFLGLSSLRNTGENPLDFRCRKAMLAETYPDIDVYYIDDIPGDDNLWSSKLDHQILKWKNPAQTVTLYGSRNSFLDHYKGNFPTVELEAATRISASEIRRRVCNNYPPTKDYRAGLIASTAQRHPVVIPTVDVAVIDRDRKRVLFIKKVNQKRLRFVGGFPSKSATYELDAKRETYEETKLETGDPLYIGSALIPDPRYEGEKDCIKTLLFAVDYIFGTPNVSNEEDLTELIESYHWINFSDIDEGIVEAEHIPLIKLLLAHLKSK